MSSLNKIILIGKITADPDVKVTTNGLTMTRFTLAVDRPDSSGIPSNQRDYFNIVSWRDTAEKAKETCKKDMMALVEGRISTRSFEDESGQRKYITEIEARLIKPLSFENKLDENKSDPINSNQFESEPVQANDSFPSSELDKSLPASFNEEVAEDVPF